MPLVGVAAAGPLPEPLLGTGWSAIPPLAPCAAAGWVRPLLGRWLSTPVVGAWRPLPSPTVVGLSSWTPLPPGALAARVPATGLRKVLLVYSVYFQSVRLRFDFYGCMDALRPRGPV